MSTEMKEEGHGSVGERMDMRENGTKGNGYGEVGERS